EGEKYFTNPHKESAVLYLTRIKEVGGLETGCVGYWKLTGDCKDYSGNNNHGINHGVGFDAKNGGRFDGKSSYIEVPNNDSFCFGNKEFSISVWVKCSNDTDSIPGDIVGKYDGDLRKGINFHVSSSASCYCSFSDVRNVYFGIDNAVEGKWVDCGRPCPSNTLISNLIVYEGQLYCGIADAVDAEDACRVFRYGGGKKWIDCGRLGSDPKVLSVIPMIVHKGELYAGTGTWDWIKCFARKAGPVHVYRYEGGKKWRDCGALGGESQTLAFASLDGNLYSSVNRDRIYRYDGDNKWTPCTEGWFDHHNSLMVYHGDLYCARATVRRYEGEKTWKVVGYFKGKYNITQTHSMAVYGGHLYLGAWPLGIILRYEGGTDWRDCGYVGIDQKWEINEVNDFQVYNGKLYAGVIPKGRVWRYEGGKKWTMVKQLVNNPKWSPKKEGIETWNRVPCMNVYKGRLYAGTSTCHGRADAKDTTDAGKVFSWEAGKCVSYDRDLGTGWRHLAAVREKDRLKLYVDGKLIASSSSLGQADYDVSNDKSMLIGFGAEDYFRGNMRELRIYNRGLSSREVGELGSKKD
ncbi:MAG: LamG domain-containing protein, partial [Planctomycetota bacterium]